MKEAQRVQTSTSCENGRLGDSTRGLLIGYMRVSKSDGSQLLDLQRDALLTEGVVEDKLFSGHCLGHQ